MQNDTKTKIKEKTNTFFIEHKYLIQLIYQSQKAQRSRIVFVQSTFRLISVQAQLPKSEDKLIYASKYFQLMSIGGAYISLYLQ